MEHALTSAELLDVWERGRFQPPVNRALSLLSLATGPNRPDRPAHISIGRRDTELYKLRELIFGPRLTGQTNCPDCCQAVEMELAVADIRNGELTEPPEASQVQFGEYELQFRLPNSEDLTSLPQGGDLATQKRALLMRCVIKASRSGEPIPADQLQDDIIAVLSERISELDPGGDVQLSLTCPHCCCHWHAPLDIVSFFWSELHAWAGRLFRDVHSLASAYGWREADILAMSAGRRRAYLEMIQP